MAEDEKQEERMGDVEIRITGDELEAYIQVIPAINSSEATHNMAVKKLKEAGVSYGINDELLNDVFERRIFDEELLIASGDAPVHGVDGEIKYYFEISPDVKPTEDEKGNVDFKELNLIKSVKKDQKLAEIIPAQPGKEGMNVKGKKIPPQEGKNPQLPVGNNTMPMPEDPYVLIAAIDGHIIFKAGPLVEVEEAYVVSGDVDFNTGNIDYVGSILIKGDVKSGFTVKVGGDVDIWGVVEDATIEAEGNVLLQKGIIGRGEGFVRANGDVILKFIENQNISCKGNVIAGESIRHSKVYADKKVIVKGKKGFIIGGEIVGTEGIEAKNIGNYQNIKTDILVGINEKMKKRLEELEHEIKQNENNDDNVKKAISTLTKLKNIKKNKFPAEKAALLTKMQGLQKVLPQQKEGFEQEKADIQKELMKYQYAEVKVFNKVYPGVKVTILNEKYAVTEERTNVSFRLIDKEVVCGTIS
ncbi:FapA family protein [candidate division KSB1 bacterium]